MAANHYDLIIIGTGAGGGTLAHRMVQSGKKILILERGSFLPREKDNWNTKVVFNSDRYHNPEVWYDKNGNELHPGMSYCVGGNTKVYGAALFRLREKDFESYPHKDGISPAWPLKYKDFEPYYIQAEKLYQVHGKGGEDPTEPFLSEEYSYPAVCRESNINHHCQCVTRRRLPQRADEISSDICIRCICNTQIYTKKSSTINIKMNTSWQILDTLNTKDFTEARLQLHYGIQLIAATGSALAEPLPDFSHTSLNWNSDLDVFIGAPIRAAKPFRVALDPVMLTSILLDQEGETISVFPLHQKTLTEGMAWLKGEVAQLGADASKIELLTYPEDFPDHAIAHGTPFNVSEAEAERQELSHYYANNRLVLQEIVEGFEDASPIHIWPHHFDMATLILMPIQKRREPITIGVGLSPGDANYAEPYWYVSPYPYPAPENLPFLDGDGFWHTQEWLGAVLPASRLTQDSGEAQVKQVKSFLRSAINASKQLLQASA